MKEYYDYKYLMTWSVRSIHEQKPYSWREQKILSGVYREPAEKCRTRSSSSHHIS